VTAARGGSGETPDTVYPPAVCRARAVSGAGSVYRIDHALSDTARGGLWGGTMKRIVTTTSLITIGLAFAFATATGRGCRAAAPVRVGQLRAARDRALREDAGLHDGEPARPRRHPQSSGRPADSCSGTQGRWQRAPSRSGRSRRAPRGSGDLTGHTCGELTAHGVAAVKTTITWYDASGANLGVTKVAAGTMTVSGAGQRRPAGLPTAEHTRRRAS